MELIDELRDTVVSEGDSATLTCAVRNPGSIDHIDVRWLKRVEDMTMAKKEVVVKMEDGKYYKVRGIVFTM